MRRGLEGEPQALAVHPDDAAQVAVATSERRLPLDAIRRSLRDGARERRRPGVFFDLDGRNICVYSAFDGQPTLARRRSAGGAATQVTLPPLPGGRGRLHRAEPRRAHEYAIATFEQERLHVEGRRARWAQIAEHGATK